MIKFKYEHDRKLFCSLHPVLIMIFSDLWWYAHSKHGVDLTVTQTVTNEEIDKKYKRTSSAHRTCRAIDVRTRNLSPEIVDDLKDYVNSNDMYEGYKYLSNSGEKRLAYYHDSGHGAHLHIAIHKKFSQP